MRSIRAIALMLVIALPGAARLAAQSENQFRWYVGAQGGAYGFATRQQDRTWVPSVGGSLLIVARKTGLLVSVDEALGSNELTGYTDATLASSIRPVNFDRVRRYGATLLGYPMRGPTRPYFGVGFNLLQVVSPAVGGFFTSATQAALAAQLASTKSTTGHFGFLAGLEFRLGGLIGFGQYQLFTAPEQNVLLHGASHSVTGGLRFPLGGAKEGIRGGGY